MAEVKGVAMCVRADGEFPEGYNADDPRHVELLAKSYKGECSTCHHPIWVGPTAQSAGLPMVCVQCGVAYDAALKLMGKRAIWVDPTGTFIPKGPSNLGGMPHYPPTWPDYVRVSRGDKVKYFLSPSTPVRLVSDPSKLVYLGEAPFVEVEYFNEDGEWTRVTVMPR